MFETGGTNLIWTAALGSLDRLQTSCILSACIKLMFSNLKLTINHKKIENMIFFRKEISAVLETCFEFSDSMIFSSTFLMFQ